MKLIHITLLPVVYTDIIDLHCGFFPTFGLLWCHIWSATKEVAADSFENSINIVHQSVNICSILTDIENPVEGLVKWLSVLGVGVLSLARPHHLVDVFSVIFLSVNEPANLVFAPLDAERMEVSGKVLRIGTLA